MGAELAGTSAAENCTYNPDGLQPCVADGKYGELAEDVVHEVMHTHGHDHVRDVVGNQADAHVGDIVFIGDAGTPYALTIGDFCGVTPIDSPPPGVHPTYRSGIPYEVGQCVHTVLMWGAVGPPVRNRSSRLQKAVVQSPS